MNQGRLTVQRSNDFRPRNNRSDRLRRYRSYTEVEIPLVCDWLAAHAIVAEDYNRPLSRLELVLVQRANDVSMS